MLAGFEVFLIGRMNLTVWAAGSVQNSDHLIIDARWGFSAVLESTEPVGHDTNLKFCLVPHIDRDIAS